MKLEWDGYCVAGLPLSGKSTFIEGLKRRYETHGMPHKLYPVGDTLKEQWRQSDFKGPFEDYFSEIKEDVGAMRDINVQIQQDMDEGRFNVLDSRFTVHMNPTRFLRFWLSAPLDVRSERAALRSDYVGKDSNEIQRILIDREHDELLTGQSIWGNNYDYRDIHLHHATIDTNNLGIEEMVDEAWLFLQGHRNVPRNLLYEPLTKPNH